MVASIAADTEDINTSGGNISLAEPASLAAGETLIVYLANYGSIPSDPGAITGFTDAVNPVAANDGNNRTQWRLCDGTEGPTYASTVGAPTAYSVGKLLRVTAGHATTPVNGTTAHNTGNSTTLTLPAVTTTVDNCLAIAFCDLSGAEAETPTGWTLYDRYDSDFSAVYYKTQVSAGSTGSATLTVASGPWFATVICIAPVSTGVTGTAAVTLASFVAAGTGTSTPPAVTGTAAVTLDGFAAAGAGVAVTTLVDAILALSPLGYWKLNEPSGTTAIDSSGNARDGTYAGPGTVTLANMAGPTGTGNYPTFANGGQVTIADNDVWSLGATTGLSFFAIIKPDSVAAYHTILTKAAASSQFEWEVALGIGTGEFDVFVYALNTAAKRWTWTAPQITAGAWQAVAVAVANNTGAAPAALYRNGTTNLASGSSTAAGTAGNGTAAVSIGYRADSPSVSVGFDGGIAHVAIFAGVLSTAAIEIVMGRANNWLAGGETGGITGTAAVTLDGFTAAGSGTFTAPNVTGTVAVTLASFAAAGSGVVAVGLFPAAVSGDARYLVDQNSDPWFGVGDTPWSLVAQLTTAEITTYLEDRSAKGINVVLFNAPEHFFGENAPNNAANEAAFTGTAFQTGLNEAYWTVVDHTVDEAARLGITCMICPAYLGFAATNEGWNDEVVAATNGQMTTYGTTLAARYAANPNIVWLIGHDRNPSATEEARQAALADALQAGAAHLVTAGGVEQLGSDAWEGSGVDYDFDTVYDTGETPTGETALGWAATPTMPTGFLEGVYEGERTYSNQYNDEPFIRNQLYGPLCAGATYVLFGNNPIWHFEFSGAPYPSSLTWQQALDAPGSAKLEILATFIGSLNGSWAGMVPDTTDTFLTVGEGTGATRAAARFDGDATVGTLAVAYRPHGGATSLTFDLTEFAAVDTVKIRKFDPADGTYTTVGTFATTGTQAVGSFGTNSAGDGDWVLVFEQSDDRTGTAAVTLAPFTSTAAGTSTPPAITGTAAVTLAVFTAAGAGTVAGPGEISGGVNLTLDPFIAAAAGTVTTPGVTGTATPTLGGFTAIAAGTYTPAAITGTAAILLGLFVAAANDLPLVILTGPLTTLLERHPRTTVLEPHPRTTEA